MSLFFLNRLFLISSANSSSQATVFEQVCDVGRFFTDVKKSQSFESYSCHICERCCLLDES
jgi:hypothetical protein